MRAFELIKNDKPLSQDDLGDGDDEREVHRFYESGFLTPVPSGSTA